MKAVIRDGYGSPDRMTVADVPVPVPGRNKVLVKVAATGINLSDWECLRGSPIYARLGGMKEILGSDISGYVDAIGREVTRFQIGDEVYGDNLWLKGGFAENAVVPEAELVLKPSGLSHVQAAAIPQPGAIAHQGMAGVQQGHRVLINGAGGGSGAFAIQLAKRAGAKVVAVDNATKLEFMAALGADEVIDYEVEDFTKGPGRYDLILDMVATKSPLGYHRALAKGGNYRAVGGSVRSLVLSTTVGWVFGRATGRRLGIMGVTEGPEHFGPVAELCGAGDIDIHIDRTFTLDQVPEALAFVGAGQAKGKAVVTIDP